MDVDMGAEYSKLISRCDSVIKNVKNMSDGDIAQFYDEFIHWAVSILFCVLTRFFLTTSFAEGYW